VEGVRRGLSGRETSRFQVPAAGQLCIYKKLRSDYCGQGQSAGEGGQQGYNRTSHRNHVHQVGDLGHSVKHSRKILTILSRKANIV
jgi:hypothetical protein